jgi:hypothetical protein
MSKNLALGFFRLYQNVPKQDELQSTGDKYVITDWIDLIISDWRDLCNDEVDSITQ